MAEGQPEGKKPTVRTQVLVTADRIIGGDRQQDYGDARESFGRIGQLWSGILGMPVTAQQVALCMVALKISRAAGKPGHADSYVDMAGYAALAAELGGVTGAP